MSSFHADLFLSSVPFDCTDAMSLSATRMAESIASVYMSSNTTIFMNYVIYYFYFWALISFWFHRLLQCACVVDLLYLLVLLVENCVKNSMYPGMLRLTFLSLLFQFS